MYHGCSLRLPDNTHNYHSDYPLAFEIMNVTADLLSTTHREYVNHATITRTRNEKNKKVKTKMIKIKKSENDAVRAPVFEDSFQVFFTYEATELHS